MQPKASLIILIFIVLAELLALAKSLSIQTIWLSITLMILK